MPQPPLRSLHPDASWNAVKLRQLDRLATGDLVRSLAPGQTNCPRRAPTGLCWRATTGFTFREGEVWTSIDCREKSLRDPKPEPLRSPSVAPSLLERADLWHNYGTCGQPLSFPMNCSR